MIRNPFMICFDELEAQELLHQLLQVRILYIREHKSSVRWCKEFKHVEELIQHLKEIQKEVNGEHQV